MCGCFIRIRLWKSAYAGYELSRFFRTAPESYEKVMYPVGLSR